jgi:hypothetical protein
MLYAQMHSFLLMQANELVADWSSALSPADGKSFWCNAGALSVIATFSNAQTR